MPTKKRFRQKKPGHTKKMVNGYHETADARVRAVIGPRAHRVKSIPQAEIKRNGRRRAEGRVRIERLVQSVHGPVVEAVREHHRRGHQQVGKVRARVRRLPHPIVDAFFFAPPRGNVLEAAPRICPVQLIRGNPTSHRDSAPHGQRKPDEWLPGRHVLRGVQIQLGLEETKAWRTELQGA